MKSGRLLSFAFIFMGIFMLLPFSGHAVARILDEDVKASPAPETDCDRFIEDGLLQFSLSTATTSVLGGGEVTVDVLLKNNHTFPLVDVGLFVEVRGESGEDVAVGQFFGVEHLEIPAMVGGKEGEQKAHFLWKVPENLPSGTYKMYPHIVFAKSISDRSQKTNAQFLPITVTSASGIKPIYQHSVKVFDGKKEAVKEETDTFFVAHNTVTVSYLVTNTTGAKVDVGISWAVFKNNIWSEDNIVAKQEEVLHLPKGGKKTISFSVPRGRNAFEYIVGTVTSGDVHSSIHIPVLWDGVPGIQIEAFGVDVDSPRGGGQGSLFACFRSTHTAEEPASLVIDMIDEEGNVLVGRSIPVTSSSSMMSAISPFFLIKDYALLHAKLSVQAGTTSVSQMALHLGCQLWENGCKRESEGRVGPAQEPLRNLPVSLLIIGSILLIFGAAVYFIEHKKRQHDLYHKE